jgi:hypothetical protein
LKSPTTLGGHRLESNDEKDLRNMKNARDVLGTITVGALVYGGALVGASSSGKDLAWAYVAVMPGYALGALAILTSVPTAILAIKVATDPLEKEYNSFKSVVNDPYTNVPWIYRPGHGLMVSGLALAAASAVPMGLAGSDFFKTNGYQDDLLVFWTGVAMGFVATGLFAGGVVQSRNAESEARLQVTPYVTPYVSRKNAVADMSSPDGAVVGLKGTF